MNEKKCQHFRKHRPIICDVAITATIKNNSFNLLSTLDPVGNKASLYAQLPEKKKEKFAKAAYSSFPYRGGCFQ